MFWLILLVGFFLVNAVVMAICGWDGNDDAKLLMCIFQTLIELGLIKVAIWLCEHVVIIL